MAKAGLSQVEVVVLEKRVVIPVVTILSRSLPIQLRRSIGLYDEWSAGSSPVFEFVVTIAYFQERGTCATRVTRNTPATILEF